ncbi:MAG: hypothetical protein HKM23_06685 [Nitrosopumilus sp.]|nr:hypothetical protein [Nitrosopumilus sp.]NNL59349.1 hypothetical protein [Nitrosopumilus sp.]
MNFDENLSNGIFLIPECTICKKIVWPPSEFCNNCFGKVSLTKSVDEGKIIEYSSNDEGYFCLVEFEKNMRIIARISEAPAIGQTVKLEKCGILEENYFFTVV